MEQERLPELRKFVVPEFVYGPGAINLVGRYAKNFGAHRALIVTDTGVIDAGWLEPVTASLQNEGVLWVVYKDVTPNPKDSEVFPGVEMLRENGCDIIIAVGGGSPIDCAKAIGIVHANGEDVLSFEGVDEVPMPGPPLICIPTTAGSSADVSQFAIINDTHRHLKVAIISKLVVPDIALIDPETTTTMPADLTAVTGLDALVHAMEAYVSNASSPITDLHALEAIPLLSNNLLCAVREPRNMACRNHMMTGSLLAGMAFSNASLGLVHAMAHSLGGMTGLAHGICNAILVKHVVAFNYPAVPERYDRIAEAMGVRIEEVDADARKDALIARLEALLQSVETPLRLSRQGVRRSDIPQLALHAFHDPCLATNPRNVTQQEIEAIYEEAF